MTTMNTALLETSSEAVKHGSSTDRPIFSGASDCSACNGKGYFHIGTGEAICRKCHPRTEEPQRPLPSIAPSLLFTEEDVKSVNLGNVFAQW